MAALRPLPAESARVSIDSTTHCWLDTGAKGSVVGGGDVVLGAGVDGVDGVE
ncbi:MAG: hypothetical protein WKF43_03620 [Acidimicrobiales bacterium]